MAELGTANIGGRAVPAWVLESTAEQVDNSKWFSRPNLLDNWYFVGGGSQQGGGQFPINQRGQVSYGTANSYTIDRWMHGPDPGEIELTENGIKFSGSVGSNLTLAQFSGLYFPQDTMVTLSALYRGQIILDYWGTTLSPSPVVESGWGLHTITYMIPAGTSLANKTYSPDIKTNGDQTSYFAAVKFELGPGQTLARQDADGNWVLLDPPPNFQQELAKCQRYLLVLSGFGWIGSGVCDSATTGQFFLPTPVSMRIAPTMAGSFRIYNQINNLQVATAATTGHTANGIVGGTTFTGGTFQAGDVFHCWLNANEKLTLSAEL